MKLTMEQAAWDILSSSKFRRSAEYVQHRRTSVMAHSIHVARFSMGLASCLERFGVSIDERSLIRGALLHDYFGYDYHDGAAPGNIHPHLHGLYHPAAAVRNAEQDFGINSRERNIILHHMWPLTVAPPTCRESWIVTVADKCCAVKEELSRRG